MTLSEGIKHEVTVTISLPEGYEPTGEYRQAKMGEPYWEYPHNWDAPIPWAHEDMKSWDTPVFILRPVDAIRNEVEAMGAKV